jgi:hypothetical protein
VIVDSRLWLSRLGLAVVSMAAAGVSASLAINSIGEGIEYGDLQAAPGATVQQLAALQAHGNKVFLLALGVTVMNAVLVWFWLPKAWNRAGRSKSLRLIVSLLTLAVTTALVAGFLFLI